VDGEATFEVRRAWFPQVAVLSVRGEIDFFTATLFRAALEAELERAAACLVVAADGTFFDAAAAFALLNVANSAERVGKSVVLAGPARFLFRILDVFPGVRQPARYPSVAEALATVRGNGSPRGVIGGSAQC
jgi:anti-anti-sigma factor